MKTLRLALDFSTDETAELVVPTARIYIAGEFPRNNDSLTYLTPDCISASELDEAIEFLKKELKTLSAEAHRKFADERRKRSTHP